MHNIEVADLALEDPPRIDATLKRCIEKDNDPTFTPAVETELIDLIPGEESKKIRIGTGLEPEFKEDLVKLLRAYPDVFAWTPKDMPGLDESVAVHKLNLLPGK